MGWVKLTMVGEDGVERPIHLDSRTGEARRNLPIEAKLEAQIQAVTDQEDEYELRRARGEITREAKR